MKIRNILLSILTVFAFGINFVDALEVSEGWTEYESGIISINIDKLLEFEDKLAYRVNALNKSNLDKIYRYKLEIEENKELEDYIKVTNEIVFDNEEEANKWSNENTPELDGYSFIQNKVNSFEVEMNLEESRYETDEDAKKVADEFKNSIDEGDVTVDEVRDEAEDITEPIFNNDKFDTFEGAENAALKLREDNHDYKVTVTVVKGTEFVKTDIKTTTEVFVTYATAQAYIDGLKELGYDVVSLTIKEVNETSSLNKKYETKSEAEQALADFLELYPETIVSDETIIEVRDETEDATETVSNNDKFDTESEANAKAEELREDTHDYKVTVTVVKGTEFVKTDTKTTTEVFATYATAQAYIDGLKELGYDVVSLTIKEVNETSSLNKKFETKSEAEQALADFLELYPETIVSDETITEVRDEEGDTITETTTGTNEYATYEEALTRANSLNEDNDTYKVVATVREGSKSVTTDPITATTNQFNTRDEAQAYIDDLKAQGYDVSGLSIELVSFEESIWGDKDDVIVDPGTGDTSSYKYGHFDVTLLTEFTKIDALGNKSNVTGTITIDSVVINGKKIDMEGPTTDRNTGLKEYTSVERMHLNFTNNSSVKVTGTVTVKGTTNALPFEIEGYLTESQNVCGGTLGKDKGFDLKFASVTIINNKVVVDTNVVYKYKVTGTYTGTTQQDVWYVDTIKTTKDYDYVVNANGVKFIGYNVLGTATKDIYKDIYTLDVVKTIKDYDYVVNAAGVKFIGYNVLGTAAKDIYKDIYTLDVVKTIKDYDYIVSGNGIKNNYEVISEYVKLANANWVIEYMEIGKGGDVEVLPPQTGVNETNVNLLFSIVSSFITGLFLVIKKFI